MGTNVNLLTLQLRSPAGHARRREVSTTMPKLKPEPLVQRQQPAHHLRWLSFNTRAGAVAKVCVRAVEVLLVGARIFRVFPHLDAGKPVRQEIL